MVKHTINSNLADVRINLNFTDTKSTYEYIHLQINICIVLFLSKIPD